MTQFVGYVGVVAVHVVEETFYDNGLVVITGEDPAHEVPGWELEVHWVPFLSAWKRAVKEIKSRNGVVVNYPPRPPRATAAKNPGIVRVQDDHMPFGVWSAPWDVDPVVFKTRRQARKYAKAHRKEIEENFDY